MIFNLVLLTAFAYILWTKVLQMYYLYWYYTKQGIAPIGFPLPLIGNLRQLVKSQKGRTMYSDSLTVEYLLSVFGKGKVPQIVIDF